VNGFGAVIQPTSTRANTTSVRFFDRNNAILGTYYAPVASGGFSFVGVFTNDGLATIARARVTLGNAILSPEWSTTTRAIDARRRRRFPIDGESDGTAISADGFELIPMGHITITNADTTSAAIDVR
jgi:hypothetical protein